MESSQNQTNETTITKKKPYQAELSYDPAIPPLCLSQEEWNQHHHGIIYNDKDTQPVQMPSIRRWMDQENMVHMHNGIWLWFLKDRNLAGCCNPSSEGDEAEGSLQVQGQTGLPSEILS